MPTTSPDQAGTPSPAADAAPRRRRSWVGLIGLCCLGAVVHLSTRPPAPTPDALAPAVTLPTARGLFPAAARLGPAPPGQAVAVYDADGRRLGSILDTTPAAQKHPGYAGPVPAAVGLGTDQRIIGVRLLDHYESPSYVESITRSGWLDRWNGLTPAEAAATTVDAVSGATMTSRAIANAVRQTLADLDPEAAPTACRVPRSLPTALAWLALALAVMRLASRDRRHWPRRLGPVANVVILGFLNGSCLSLALACGWLSHGLPWRQAPFLVTMAAVALLGAVLTGRPVYCTCLCPYGSAQDLMARLWRGRRRPGLPSWLSSSLDAVRGGVLLGVAWMLFWPRPFDAAALEPFSAFQWRSAPAAALVLALVFLALSLVFPRLWCRHLCPSGRLLEVFRARPAEAVARRGLDLERALLAAALVAALRLAWRLRG